MDLIPLMLTPLTHWGVLIGGTLLFFILGWLWYNPITPIGQVWIKYFPMPSKDKMPSGAQMGVMLVFQLFMGFVITHTVMTLWLFSTTH